jgi:hypothetical protein
METMNKKIVRLDLCALLLAFCFSAEAQQRTRFPELVSFGLSGLAIRRVNVS